MSEVEQVLAISEGLGLRVDTVVLVWAVFELRKVSEGLRALLAGLRETSAVPAAASNEPTPVIGLGVHRG